MAELVLGSVALYVWLLSEPGIVTAVAFNVILIAGVSTLVVNGNPLMRYDGYYILCDVLELPNLAQRSTQYWTYLLDRHAFGALDAQPPVESRKERGWLIAYGAVAPFYRLGVSLGLVWFIATEYFFAGVLLAIAGAWTALAMPVWKGWKHLTQGGSLASRRQPAMRRTGVALGGVLALLCFLPLPFYSVHQAVVWLPEDAIVRPAVAGHVELTHVAAGQQVTRGMPLVQLGSLTLEAEAEAAEAMVQALESKLRQAEVGDRVRAQALRSELEAQRAKLADLRRRVGAQVLTARADGRWTPAPATELGGRYVRRGEVLGYVVNGPSSLLRVAVTQEDMNLIGARVRHVEARLGHGLREAIPGHLSMHATGGTQDLVSPALGTSGGGDIPVDPSQPGGARTLHRVFDVEIALDRPSPGSVFGDRAHVRFDLGWAPLGWQWFLRLRQLFLARLYV
jgi:putative peptide zinc metalloprotease protein